MDKTINTLTTSRLRLSLHNYFLEFYKIFIIKKTWNKVSTLNVPAFLLPNNLIINLKCNCL